MPTVYYGPSVCNCDGVDYTKTDVENAAALALELTKKGRTIALLRMVETGGWMLLHGHIYIPVSAPTVQTWRVKTKNYTRSLYYELPHLTPSPRSGLVILKADNDSKCAGDDRYPHVYNDYEHFNFAHAEAPYLVFPILQKGKIYDGLSPGAERLVLGSIAEDFSSAIYCACLTKDGQRKNGFAECKDNTMNPRGKGMLPTEGRKLVGRIDL